MSLKFVIVSEEEAKKISKPNLFVYVNRRQDFKPPKHLVDNYNDILKRMGTKPMAREFANNGSHYDFIYRKHILDNSKTKGELRKLAMEAKEHDVFLVGDVDRPELYILVDIAKTMVNNHSW